MDCCFKTLARRRKIADGCMLLCCLALLLLPGCSGTSAVDIHGKVTFQGKPLESGVICFMPINGKGAAKTADIKNGQYAVNIPRGEMRVEISSVSVSGQKQVMVGGQLRAVDVKKEMIPEKYNQKSELRADITDGNKELDFNI